ncbi:MAG: type II toxin-antitoxin system RelE/ParE family toxin [Oscillospiraceae bacterium]|jgi:hypothetical protein|nr:type II toxin-antitoxin system RelE/ParE family toxin [Oscillospiraceae bacterium]
MNREFVMTSEFDKQWGVLGFVDSDLYRLQREILENPKVGAVIRGAGRLRKMRFAPEGHGKSGGSRVLYVDFVVQETVYLITAYAKSKKENLTNEQRNSLKVLVDALEKSL